jgi:hypothetical protein
VGFGDARKMDNDLKAGNSLPPYVHTYTYIESIAVTEESSMNYYN